MTRQWRQARARSACIPPSYLAFRPDFLERYHGGASAQPATAASTLLLRTNASDGDAGTAVPPATEPSHFQLVAALEVEDVARLVRGRHFEAKTLDDLAGELHLFGVRCRHAARRRPQRIFQPYPDVSSHCRCHRRNRQLIAS